MKFFQIVDLVHQNQKWIKSQINNINYRTSTNKYYGSINSINYYIEIKKLVEAIDKRNLIKDEHDEEYYYNYEEGDEFGNDRRFN